MGLLSSGTSHGDWSRNHSAHTWLSAWSPPGHGWLSPWLAGARLPLVPQPQWDCQRMETPVQPPLSQSPVSTNVCSSGRHALVPLSPLNAETAGLGPGA